MQDGFTAAAALLPFRLKSAAERLPQTERRTAEEFRLRIGQRPTLYSPTGEHVLTENAVGAEDISAVIENASRASVHAVTDELRHGYISAPGGIRVGVCGTAVMGDGVAGLRDYSSLCIRIPRQLCGAGEKIMKRLCSGGSVLILSPPGGGKTTLLRELVRTVSDAGAHVCVADERGEIAGMYCGSAAFQIGACTDVISAAPKAEAAMMLLRAMGPEVIAMDEISAPEDAAAVELLHGCGVRVFATAHAESFEDFLEKRPWFRRLAELGVFQTAVRISGRRERAYEVTRL